MDANSKTNNDAKKDLTSLIDLQKLEQNSSEQIDDKLMPDVTPAPIELAALEPALQDPFLPLDQIVTEANTAEPAPEKTEFQTEAQPEIFPTPSPKETEPAQPTSPDLNLDDAQILAQPPFTFYAFGERFKEEKTKEWIKDFLKSEDFGVTLPEIELQLSSGKLFIPHISEFAAVLLGQKIRDIAENIEIKLS